MTIFRGKAVHCKSGDWFFQVTQVTGGYHTTFPEGAVLCWQDSSHEHVYVTCPDNELIKVAKVKTRRQLRKMIKRYNGIQRGAYKIVGGLH